MFYQFLTANQPHILLFSSEFWKQLIRVENIIIRVPHLGKVRQPRGFQRYPDIFPTRGHRPPRSLTLTFHGDWKSFLLLLALYKKCGCSNFMMIRGHHGQKTKPAERVLTGSLPGNSTELEQFRWGSWFSFRKFRLNNQFLVKGEMQFEFCVRH